ncbi:hypothetical protein ACWA5Z_04190 [Testudinibacter sp. P80/BLE/0925]|uniref:hypothetical protein n=1 Tax=Testudinibacter sp. TW-1 TaxID=3417757 RepID=UPI003D366464
MGGECEIAIPKLLFDKFCDNEAWRLNVINRFAKILFLALPELNIPIPESERNKTGVVPIDWK